MDKGDRVKVISNCQSYGKTGTVLGYVNYPHWYSAKYVRVALDNGQYKTYNEKSLKRLTNDKVIRENKTMSSISGNYHVAMVRFIQGTNTTKHYSFALFDTNIVIGDKVLCDTSNGYGVAEVVEIMSKDSYSGSPVTKEIICKCDFTDFNNRATMRKQKQTIKAKMDKMLHDNQELILYQAIADKNPEMAELLAMYKALSEV